MIYKISCLLFLTVLNVNLSYQSTELVTNQNEVHFKNGFEEDEGKKIRVYFRTLFVSRF